MSQKGVRFPSTPLGPHHPVMTIMTICHDYHTNMVRIIKIHDLDDRRRIMYRYMERLRKFGASWPGLTWSSAQLTE
jgi:hypothetical protein